MGLIYKIYNDVNKKLYIGKTVTTLSHRWEQHISEAKIDPKWQLHKAMNKYGIEHFFIEQIEECDDTILNEREQYWINFYDTFKNGYNMTIGGEGHIWIDRNQVRNYWYDGYSVTEIAQKMSCWPSTIIDILKELSLYNMEEVQIRKNSYLSDIQKPKEVVQYDEEGNQIQTFRSCYEAAKTVNGSSDSIHNAITSKGSRYGYYWAYKDSTDLPNFKKIIRPQIRPIYQYTKQGEYLNSYPNAAEAARANNMSSASTILRVCKGERKSAGGYFWSYEKT